MQTAGGTALNGDESEKIGSSDPGGPGGGTLADPGPGSAATADDMPEEESDPESGPMPESSPESAPEGSSGGARRWRIPVVVGFVTVAVLALDQLAKLLAVTHLSDRPPVELLGGLLQLTLVYNSGAAFGLAAGYTIPLTVLALGVATAVGIFARRATSLPWGIAFGLLLGGALGNLADRFFREPGPFRGHVVDFLELPYWPVFNLADTAVVSAAALILLLSITGRHLDGTVDRAKASAE